MCRARCRAMLRQARYICDIPDACASARAPSLRWNTHEAWLQSCGHRRRATRGAGPCAAALRAARAHPARSGGRDAAMGPLARRECRRPAAVRPPWEPMRLIAEVTDRGSIDRILAYFGEPSQIPHVAPTARGPPWEEDFDTPEGEMFTRANPCRGSVGPANERVGGVPPAPAGHRTSTSTRHSRPGTGHHPQDSLF